MAARIITLFTLFTISFYGFSQELVCGTEPTKRDIEALRKLDVNAYKNMRVASPIRIAISAHIVRQSNGTGGLTQGELEAAIVDVNEIYELTNMEFFIFGDINYIDSDEYFNFDTSQELELASQHFVENTINVYFFNSAVSGETSLCGYTRFPESEIDRVMMVNSCTTNGSTFPHELGHYFALYHTHGKSNSGTTDELVTRDEGANCETAGDDLCDTAADPNLSGLVDASCNYTGSGTDTNGDTYVPDPNNLMSYSQKHCRYIFSQGQADRISAAYQEYKTYLYDKNYLADFDVLSREVCEGDALSFIDQSVNAESYVWTFEGGTPASSTDPNPSVTYAVAGTYDVSLTITAEGEDTDTKTFEDYVTVKSSVSSEITSKSGSFEQSEIAELIYNSDESITWDVSSSAATEGSNSVFMDFYSYSSVGEEDYLVIATLNTSEEKAFALTFDYAYAAYSDSYYDGLEIVYRDPCGLWQTAWFKDGDDLATAPDQEGFFTPSSQEWVSESIIFTIDEEVEVVEFAFKAINGYGNALYIDNYSIDVFDASFSIDDVEVANAFCPDSDEGTMVVTISGSGSFEYSIDGESFSSSNEITGLAPSTYTVVVRNAIGTEETQEVTVGYDNEYPEKPVITEADGSLSVTLSEGQTVEWFLDGAPLEETTSSIEYDGSGAYIVAVSNGSCATLSDEFIILGVDGAQDDLRIYPNPAQSFVTFTLESNLQKEVISVSVSDLTGREIMRKPYSQAGQGLDVSSLESGIYFIHLELEGQKISKRFLKQ